VQLIVWPPQQQQLKLYYKWSPNEWLRKFKTVKPGRGESEQPLTSEYYKEVAPLGHYNQSRNCPIAFIYTYKNLFCKAGISFGEGIQI
jgi:hypothetical protein